MSGLIDIHSLPSRAFGDWRKLPPVSAVYFVIVPDSEVFYIGQAVDLKRRWAGRHEVKKFDFVEGTRIAFLRADESELKTLEVQYIRRFRPTLNRYQTGESRTAHVQSKVSEATKSALEAIAAKNEQTESSLIADILDEYVARITMKAVA